MNTNTKIDELKKEIEQITEQINKRRLSPSEVQVMNDLIADKKREIEKLSKTGQTISPVIGAPTIADKDNDPIYNMERETRFII